MINDFKIFTEEDLEKYPGGKTYAKHFHGQTRQIYCLTSSQVNEAKIAGNLLD